MTKGEALGEAIAIYNELLRVHQLNIELLNALERSLVYVQDFCKNHNIPFQDEKLCSSIAKIDILLNEIDCGASLIALCKPADESLQHKQTDKDFTEPLWRFW